jgi:hypothetical protein
VCRTEEEVILINKYKCTRYWTRRSQAYKVKGAELGGGQAYGLSADCNFIVTEREA